MIDDTGFSLMMDINKTQASLLGYINLVGSQIIVLSGLKISL